MKRFKSCFLTAFAIGAVNIAVHAQSKPTDTAAVTLHTSKGDIEGTMQLVAAKKKVPVALIISGSGPTDRDGNSGKMINNSLRMLADSLQKYGIASVRYDKRGIGASKKAAPAEDSLHFEDYIHDAEDWIKLLRKDPRYSKVYVIGHSEGSLIGMSAGNHVKIDGFVSIAGPGQPIDKTLREQLKTKVPQEMMDSINKVLDQLVNGKQVANVDPQLNMLFRPSVQPYLISWMKYDPQKEIAKLNAPVLILQGTNDSQVSKEDAKELSLAAKGAKMQIVEGMNHIMKTSGADVVSYMETLMNPNMPIRTEAVQAIVQFIK